MFETCNFAPNVTQCHGEHFVRVIWFVLWGTLLHCIQTSEDIVKLFSQPDSPVILVFLTQSACTQFQGKPLQWELKIQGGGEILRFLTEFAVYLGNCTR